MNQIPTLRSHSFLGYIIGLCFGAIIFSPKSTNITSKSNASYKLTRSEAILLVRRIFYLYTFCVHNYIFYAAKKKTNIFYAHPMKDRIIQVELKEKTNIFHALYQNEQAFIYLCHTKVNRNLGQGWKQPNRSKPITFKSLLGQVVSRTNCCCCCCCCFVFFFFVF